nr:hypothetical protein [Conexibacter sp. W3-3-2]
MSKHRVFVIGVGMTKFEKPGSKQWDYPDMAREAGTTALEDAGVGYEQIEAAAAGYVYGELLRRAGALRAGNHRNPGVQRQQQLLDRIDRALPGGEPDPRRPERLRTGRGL